MKENHFSVMVTSRILGTFIFLLIYFSICFYNDKAVTHFMTSVDVKDINIESTVVPADINVLEAEEHMSSNNQKHRQGKEMRHQKRKKRDDLYEENLSDTKQGNAPAPGSLGKYFVYVNCTECKVNSELVVKSKNTKKSREKSKSTKKSTEKSKSRIRTTEAVSQLKLYHNKNLIQEDEKRLARVEHEDEEQEEPYQKEEMSIDKEEVSETKDTKRDSYDITLYYITNVSFKDGEVYQVTDVEIETSKETSIENVSTEKVSTAEEKSTVLITTETEEQQEEITEEEEQQEETTEEKKQQEEPTEEEKQQRMRNNRGGGTTGKATTGINTTGGKTTTGEATTKKQ